jgi:hypothetical protein
MNYIYCVASEPRNHSLGNIGIRGAEVSTASFKDICVLTSQIPDTEAMKPEDALTHERVILRAMKDGSVVPVGFGLFARNEKDIVGILKQGLIPFKETIERLRGTVQVDLRVSWNNQVLSDVMNEKDVKLSYGKLKEAPNSVALKVELGRRIKESLTEEEKKLIPGILNSLNALAIGCKERKIENSDMIFNNSFLVKDSDSADFLSKVDELEDAYQGVLRFRCVTPLPPYDFVNLSVKKVRFEQVSKAKKILGLDDPFSLSDVEIVFKKLIRLSHTDDNTSPGAEHEFRALKSARDLLVEYCENYPCNTDDQLVEDRLIVSLSGHRTIS